MHNNARSKTAASTKASLEQFSWKISDYPTYSSDLVPSSHHLFSKMEVLQTTQLFIIN